MSDGGKDELHPLPPVVNHGIRVFCENVRIIRSAQQEKRAASHDFGTSCEAVPCAFLKESHTREIAANIPNAELTIIKGGHFIANQRPTEFNRAVDAFLKKLPE